MTKEESRVYHRNWYAKQTKQRKAQKTRLQRERRQRTAAWLKAYKTSIGCEYCPENDHKCLDFHHCKGRKSFDLSRATGIGISLETIKNEIAKCIILCSNCHRKTTFK